MLYKSGKSFYVANKKLTNKEYLNLIEYCPEAWVKYKKGKTWNP